MVRSILDQNAFLHGGGPVWATRKLQTLQNHGLRICENIRDPRGVDIDLLHGRLNVTKIETTETRQLLCLLHKHSKDANNVLIKPRVLRGMNRIKLKVMRVKKDIYAKSPLFRGAPLWDGLDDHTQKLNTHKEFLAAIKRA